MAFWGVPIFLWLCFAFCCHLYLYHVYLYKVHALTGKQEPVDHKKNLSISVSFTLSQPLYIYQFFFNYFQVLSKRYVKKNVFYFLKIKTQQLMLNFVLIFLTDQAIGCLLDTTQVMLIQPTYDQICTMLMQVP